MSGPRAVAGARALRKAQRASSFGPARFFLAARERRALAALYGFCRAVDDAADEMAPPQGRALLSRWEKVLRHGRPGLHPPEPAEELLAFLRDYHVPASLLRELILGARSDLRSKVRFSGPAALDLYCHRVAGVVGQACLPLFGVSIQKGRAWAETLGRALQWINFIRDAAQDARRGRIYFSRVDLRAHGVDEKQWLAGRPGAAGRALLVDAAGRAARELERAWEARAELEGKANLKPADLMADAYGRLLEKMRRDGVRVFEKRYRLGRAEKLALLLRRWWRSGR